MGRPVKSPKKHIISCRISELELETLRHLTEAAGTNISELLRQSLLQLCDQSQQSSRQAA